MHCVGNFRIGYTLGCRLGVGWPAVEAQLKLLRAACRFIVRCFFGLFVGYWAIFLLYTIKNLAEGGPKWVMAWYAHVSTEGYALPQTPWDWRVFVFRQCVILILTIGAGILVFRWMHPHNRRRV